MQSVACNDTLITQQPCETSGSDEACQRTSSGLQLHAHLQQPCEVSLPNLQHEKEDVQSVACYRMLITQQPCQASLPDLQHEDKNCSQWLADTCSSLAALQRITARSAA